MIAIKPTKMMAIKPKKIMTMRPREIVAINCRNDGNKTKGSGFYKKLILLGKKNLVKTMLLIVA